VLSPPSDERGAALYAYQHGLCEFVPLHHPLLHVLLRAKLTAPMEASASATILASLSDRISILPRKAASALVTALIDPIGTHGVQRPSESARVSRRHFDRMLVAARLPSTLALRDIARFAQVWDLRVNGGATLEQIRRSGDADWWRSLGRWSQSVFGCAPGVVARRFSVEEVYSVLVSRAASRGDP
jgi:hypothetical protein